MDENKQKEELQNPEAGQVNETPVEEPKEAEASEVTESAEPESAAEPPKADAVEMTERTEPEPTEPVQSAAAEEDLAEKLAARLEFVIYEEADKDISKVEKTAAKGKKSVSKRKPRKQEAADAKQKSKQPSVKAQVPGKVQASGEAQVSEKESASDKLKAAQRQKPVRKPKPIRPLGPGAIRRMTWALIAIAVVVLAGIVHFAVRHWKYRTLKTESTIQTDLGSADTFLALNRNILRLGTEGAVLYGKDDTTVWEAPYSMSHPQAVTAGSYAAIYDVGGTAIQICSEDQALQAFSTGLPIVKASVSEQGNVAVIEGEDTNVWIRYYGNDGTLIASVRTSVTEPGYPIQLALSPDGLQLAVSYLGYSENQVKSKLVFYHFGEAGQNQNDNETGAFEFEDHVAPALQFIDNNTLAVIRDNGVTVFSGASAPKEKAKQDVNESITTAFFGNKYFGIILKQDDSEYPFLLEIYNADGKRILEKKLKNAFERAEFSGDQISLYASETMTVYNLQGNLKYEGEAPANLFALGTKRYAATDRKGITRIRLK